MCNFNDNIQFFSDEDSYNEDSDEEYSDDSDDSDGEILMKKFE